MTAFWMFWVFIFSTHASFSDITGAASSLVKLCVYQEKLVQRDVKPLACVMQETWETAAHRTCISFLQTKLFTWQQSCPDSAPQHRCAPPEQRGEPQCWLPRYDQGWIYHSMECFSNLSPPLPLLQALHSLPQHMDKTERCFLVGHRETQAGAEDWPISHKVQNNLLGTSQISSDDGDAWSLLIWSLLRCLLTSSYTWQRKDECVWSSAWCSDEVGSKILVKNLALKAMP